MFSFENIVKLWTRNAAQFFCYLQVFFSFDGAISCSFASFIEATSTCLIEAQFSTKLCSERIASGLPCTHERVKFFIPEVIQCDVTWRTKLKVSIMSFFLGPRTVILSLWVAIFDGRGFLINKTLWMDFQAKFV